MKWSGTTGLKIIEKATNVQRKILKDLQKPFYKITRKSGSLKAKCKEIRGGARL